MTFTVEQIAKHLNGELFGESSLQIKNLAKIEEAKEGDLTFLYLEQYEKFYQTTQASAIIVKKGFNKTRNDIAHIEVDNPNKSFFGLLAQFFPPIKFINSIDSTAYISPNAKIGKNVSIGCNVVVSDNCEVGDNTTILHNSVILNNAKIGSNCLIYPNVSIRENCIIGNNVILQPGVVIGSDGFGFVPDETTGAYLKIPQVGNVVLEDDVEIGANTCIDRAMLGSTVIKKGVKLDNLIQIAHNVVVGDNTVISAQSGISGSTTVGKNCMIAGQVGLVNHIHITDKVIIGAQSGISKSITKPGFYIGTPIKESKEYMRTEAHIRNLDNYVKRIKALEENS